MKMLNLYHSLRRQLLKVLIPEFFWPKHIILDTVKIRIRNMPYSFGTKLELTKGQYEINERELIKGRIKNGETIFEFGGSIGILTSILHNYIGSNGRIVSVEASKKLAEYNNRLFPNDTNVKIIAGYGFPVYELANSINIDKFDESGGSLGGTVSYSKNLSNNLENQSVIYDLKRIINESKMEPDILVIDIEGSELIFLDQTPGFPKKIRLILIELHPHIYGVDKMKLIISSIKNEGFEIVNDKGHVYLFEKKLNN